MEVSNEGSDSHAIKNVIYETKTGEKKRELKASDFTVDSAAELMQKLVPDVWKAVYTKHIDNPGSHYGFKALAVAFSGAILETYSERGKKAGAAANIAAAAGVMQRHNYPTYYVSKPLLSSMMHTHPPKDMTWKGVTFPFPGVAFMVPRNMLFEPGGEEIMLVGATVTNVGDTITVPGTKIKVSGQKGDGTPWEEARITIFWSVRPGLVVQDCTFPVSQLLEPSPGWIDEHTEKWRELTQYPLDGPTGTFSSYMAGILANLLLVMSARPILVEQGSNTRKRLKSGLSVHSPTFLGKKYEIIRQTKAIATGAHFTELGWRSGHLKVQHFGKESQESKIIFIDPYIAFTRGLVATEKE